MKIFQQHLQTISSLNSIPVFIFRINPILFVCVTTNHKSHCNKNQLEIITVIVFIPIDYTHSVECNKHE